MLYLADRQKFDLCDLCAIRLARAFAGGNEQALMNFMQPE
jgi:hypothetical protein